MTHLLLILLMIVVLITKRVVSSCQKDKVMLYFQFISPALKAVNAFVNYQKMRHLKVSVSSSLVARHSKEGGLHTMVR